MSLNNKKYKEFYFGSLISEIYKAKAINKIDLDTAKGQSTSIYYITRTRENNWCEMIADISWINKNYIEKWNAITIWDTTATCFYQDKQFIAWDHMVVIRASWLNKYTWLYIVTLLNREQYKYSYGRAFVMNKIKNTVLKLPINDSWDPDREFMENYIKSLHHKPITTKNKSWNHGFNTNKWNEFSLDSIFSLKWWFYNKKPEHSIVWTIPFLASTESNNWVTEYYSLEDIKIRDKIWNQDNTLNKKLYDWNCIAVTVNGSVCNAFYQNNQFTCSHDITALYLKWYELNQYIAMFLCSIIMKEKYRWSYWRKPHDVKKFWKSIIKLPVDKNWNPDREFMENYIKNLPYWDRI